MSATAEARKALESMPNDVRREYAHAAIKKAYTFDLCGKTQRVCASALSDAIREEPMETDFLGNRLPADGDIAMLFLLSILDPRDNKLNKQICNQEIADRLAKVLQKWGETLAVTDPAMAREILKDAETQGEAA